jgi:hypothetical protein
MTRATFTTAAIAFPCCTAPLVTYESPCECRDNHSKQRWAEKNDPAVPPNGRGAIQAMTPSASAGIYGSVISAGTLPTLCNVALTPKGRSLPSVRHAEQEQVNLIYEDEGPRIDRAIREFAVDNAINRAYR